MMTKNKSKRKTIVYSTNPDFEYEYESEGEENTLAPQEQYLEIHIDRKQRKGKTATLIKGFVGTSDDLKDLAKNLKQKCGIGGNAKDGEIILQGEVRQKVMDLLQQEGYNCKRVGG